MVFRGWTTVRVFAHYDVNLTTLSRDLLPYRLPLVLVTSELVTRVT